MDSKHNLSTLKRGLKVLSLLNVRHAMSVTQLATEMRLPRTTARRVFDTLVEEGYVEKTGTDNLYRITPMVNMLSSGFSDESWIAHVAEPLLASKTAQFGWPLVIATPVGQHMLVRVSTRRQTALAVDHHGVGFRTPMLHGTSGHVMLAFMSARHRELMLRMLRSSPDPKQAIARDDARVRAMLATVRSRGYAHVVYREYPEASVGVPIFHEAVARACLLMVYGKTSIGPAAIESEYVPMLQQLAADIEAQSRRSRQPKSR